jgi:hypothetical protein
MSSKCSLILVAVQLLLAIKLPIAASIHSIGLFAIITYLDIA